MVIRDENRKKRSCRVPAESHRNSRITGLESVPVNRRSESVCLHIPVLKTYPPNRVTHPPLTPVLKYIVTKSLFSH